MGKRREVLFLLPESVLPVDGESHVAEKVAVSNVTHPCDGHHSAVNPVGTPADWSVWPIQL